MIPGHTLLRGDKWPAIQIISGAVHHFYSLIFRWARLVGSGTSWCDERHDVYIIDGRILRTSRPHHLDGFVVELNLDYKPVSEVAQIRTLRGNQSPASVDSVDGPGDCDDQVSLAIISVTVECGKSDKGKEEHLCCAIYCSSSLGASTARPPRRPSR